LQRAQVSEPCISFPFVTGESSRSFLTPGGQALAEGDPAPAGGRVISITRGDPNCDQEACPACARFFPDTANFLRGLHRKGQGFAG